MTDSTATPPPPSTDASGKDRLLGVTEKLLDQTADLSQLLSSLLVLKAQGQRSTNNWFTLRRTFVATVAIGALLAYLIFYANLLGFQSDPLTHSVAVVSINGEISQEADASADNIVPVIERACTASHVDSLLLVINSGGGAPAESERMISAIEACKRGDATHKPIKVVALIDSIGASAAYMIAMHADTIYAGRYSLVGSIGAIMRVNDISELATRFGVKEHDYRTSPLKGGPSLITGPTDQDSAEFQRLVTTMGRQFLAEVQQERGKKLKLTADQLFTGQVWTSTEALQNGLIDGLADREDLERTLYKGQKLHDYKTKPSAGKMFGFQDAVRQSVRQAVHQAVSDLNQPTLN